MNTRSIIVALPVALACACGPAERPAFSPATTATEPTVVPAPPMEPAFIYYRMVQAGHVELVVDEVRLDPTKSQCFHAHRRLLGGIVFDRGAQDPDPSASSEAERVVKVWKEGAKKGGKPSLVLHAHADRDEVDDAQAAHSLSVNRAEAIRTWLVDRGIPRDLIQVEAHGWDKSAVPLEPSEALLPNRRVEISHDRTPPSESKITETASVDPDLFDALLQRVKQLEGTPSSESRHAPRVQFVVNDGTGKVEIGFDVASSSPEAAALHRYFLAGLSNACQFGPLP